MKEAFLLARSQLRMPVTMHAAKDVVRFELIELRPSRSSEKHLTNVDTVLGCCNIEQAKILCDTSQRGQCIGGWCLAVLATDEV